MFPEQEPNRRPRSHASVCCASLDGCQDVTPRAVNAAAAAVHALKGKRVLYARISGFTGRDKATILCWLRKPEFFIGRFINDVRLFGELFGFCLKVHCKQLLAHRDQRQEKHI